MLRGTPLLFAAAVLVCLTTSSPAHAARARAADGLQLTLIAPDNTAVGDRLPIDVSYRGAVPDTFEMYLDGSLVAKRQMTGGNARGVVSFSLDTMLLAEGLHSVQIRGTDSEGRAAVVSGRIRVPGVDLSAAVRIAYPANGIEVSGVVPIRVGLSESMARESPYVSFFVDRQLKVLRNYPPYEYSWDTSTVSNGWHVLEAWTQLPDAAKPYKARPVHVNVNNAGGATQKQDAITDLRTNPTIQMPIAKPATPQAKAPAIARPLAASAPARTALGPLVPAVRGRAGGAQPLSSGTAITDSRAQEPDASGMAFQAAPGLRAGVRPSAARTGRGAPSMAGGAVEVPRGRMVIASNPVATGPDLTQMGLAQPKPTATARVRPGEDVAALSRRTGVQASEIRRLNNIEPSGRLTTGQRLIIPQSGVFSVAMDGAQIAFDVPPRIDRGVALAPFRSLFEYAGGVLYWYNPTKRVHAVSSTREVELQIGSSMALVNNRRLGMDRQALLDHGRTIVPMSFVSEVLDVVMSYDNHSGRLLLQSKR